MQQPPLASYWRFAIPLVVLGPMMTAGSLAQQAALLDVQAGVRELAAFALAVALLNPFANVLGMVPQLGTVLGRDRSGYLTVKRLVLGLGLGLFVLVAVMAASPAGAAVIRFGFQVEEDLIAIVGEYLLWFAMSIPLLGMQKVATGGLIRAQRTATVTAIRIGDVALVIGILILGHRLDWGVRSTLIASRLLPDLVATIVTCALHHPLVPQSDQPEMPRTGLAQALRFFAPMAFTTTMFTLSRPVLFAFVTMVEGKGARSEVMIAALSLAFSLGFLFQSMINNVLRNLLATFVDTDPIGCRRFTIQLSLLVTVAAALFLLGPPAQWFLGSVMGAEGPVLDLAHEAAAVLVLSPIVIAWRNWYHGLAMAHRRTGAMFVGSLGRNVCIVGGAALLAAVGWLDHRWAAAVLVAAFACEALGTIVASRGWRAQLAAPACQVTTAG